MHAKAIFLIFAGITAVPARVDCHRIPIRTFDLAFWQSFSRRTENHTFTLLLLLRSGIGIGAHPIAMGDNRMIG
jgi:hypothetical protein